MQCWRNGLPLQFRLGVVVSALLFSYNTYFFSFIITIVIVIIIAAVFSRVATKEKSIMVIITNSNNINAQNTEQGSITTYTLPASFPPSPTPHHARLSHLLFQSGLIRARVNGRSGSSEFGDRSEDIHGPATCDRAAIPTAAMITTSDSLHVSALHVWEVWLGWVVYRR